MTQQILPGQWSVDCRQWMGWCDRKSKLQYADQLGHIAAARRTVACRANHQVCAAVQQSFPGARQGLMEEAKTRAVSNLVKGPQLRREQVGRKQPFDSDTELGLPAARDAPDFMLQTLCSQQQFASVGQQGAARCRQLHPRPGAKKQDHVQILFQLRDRVGNCRGNPKQFLGSRSECAAPVNGVEHQQSIQA